MQDLMTRQERLGGIFTKNFVKSKENGMLILTRRVGETVVINDDIRVIVLGVKGNQVRLGIDAPRGIPVHRQEIQRRIDAEKEIQNGGLI